MEHRWGRRVQVDFPVRVTSRPFWVRDGRLADLSVSGALLESPIEARKLRQIRIAIVLPLWPKHESPVIDAYVARGCKRGFGTRTCAGAPPPRCTSCPASPCHY